jgi:alkanesulfonate monooxygenase SsuD/methylene tetrahydromethanopterin reductase-like flavin-dependent oxidoreductase (luciferase family)
MGERTRRRRLDSFPWGSVLGVVSTTLCSVWALWASLVGHAHHVSGRSFAPFAVPLLVGWMAVRRPERPWPTWVWASSAGAVLAVAASFALPIRFWGAAWAAVGVVLLLVTRVGDARCGAGRSSLSSTMIAGKRTTGGAP